MSDNYSSSTKITYPSNKPKLNVTSDDINREALREFSREELQSMPKPMVYSIVRLIHNALSERGPILNKAELEGIREIVTEHLYPRWWVDNYLRNHSPQTTKK
ncbi:hypothetical protein XMG59_001159 [Marinobacterium sp. xm-g-59]|nr:hypothetical protein [Marinobacterium sp. xm-g-59]